MPMGAGSVGPSAKLQGNGCGQRWEKQGPCTLLLGMVLTGL